MATKNHYKRFQELNVGIYSNERQLELQLAIKPINQLELFNEKRNEQIKESVSTATRIQTTPRTL